MPMPDAERWRSDLLALELSSFASTVIACREAIARASNLGPDEPGWYVEACDLGASTWARSVASHVHRIIRHARETEDQLHDERERP